MKERVKTSGHSAGVISRVFGSQKTLNSSKKRVFKMEQEANAEFFYGLRALFENSGQRVGVGVSVGVAVVDSIQMGSNYPDMSSGISAKPS